MNKTKLVALLLVSFFASASVVYQIRNRRPARGTVVGSAPEPKPGGSPAAPAPIPVAAKAADEPANVVKPDQNRGPAPNIPETGWGRSPFLTPEEINKMNQPEQIATVQPPPAAPKPHAEPPGLPTYAITGIISGDQGRWAIVDGRILRSGERIGAETLKEVKDRGVVLEHEGRIRELPLRTLEETAAAAPPKKEAKP